MRSAARPNTAATSAGAVVGQETAELLARLATALLASVVQQGAAKDGG